MKDKWVGERDQRERERKIEEGLKEWRKNVYGAGNKRDIIESVDSISRDGPDCPYNYVIHYKIENISVYVQFQVF